MDELNASFTVLTPPGQGGMAVVEIVGPDRGAATERLLRSPRGRGWRSTGTGVPRLASLAPRGELIDEVLVVERPERGSIELQLHGSQAVLDALAELVPLIWRRAPGGPAEHLLQHALGPSQLALALEQRSVEWRAWIDGLADLSFDARRGAVAVAVERSRVARALAEPCAVALIGARNAGKSTLLNRLLFSERVLTGALPGLTRDPVADHTLLEGYPYRIIDTAGEGSTEDPLERLAIERGREQRSGALLVLVVDGHRGFGESDRALAAAAGLIVRSKADLPRTGEWPEGLPSVVELSCIDPAGSAEVRARIGAALRRIRVLPAAPEDGVGGPAALDAAQQAELDALARRG